MPKLDPRPEDINKQEDINVPSLKKILNHYDDQLNKIDNRRLAQMTSISGSATLSDVISKLNSIISALNDSDFTED